MHSAGADPEILKKGRGVGGWGGGRGRSAVGGGRGALFIGHHNWSTKKILSFRWSKKAKITLQTKAFGETFLSIFPNFLCFYI